MTLATGRRGRGRSRGFTLFEILITLSIIVLFSGFFLLRFDDGATEEALAQASNDMRAAALKAKKRSYAFRRDHFVVFSRNGFTLMEKVPGDENFGFFPDTNGTADYRENYKVPSGVTMELLRPGETKWNHEPGYVWIFRSSGLSDPLSVRFSSGRSFTRLTFNVLTAMAEEETFLE